MLAPSEPAPDKPPVAREIRHYNARFNRVPFTAVTGGQGLFVISESTSQFGPALSGPTTAVP